MASELRLQGRDRDSWLREWLVQRQGQVEPALQDQEPFLQLSHRIGVAGEKKKWSEKGHVLTVEDFVGRSENTVVLLRPSGQWEDSSASARGQVQTPVLESPWSCVQFGRGVLG